MTQGEKERRYNERHPGRRAEISRRYRERNPEKIVAYNKKYRAEHPEFVKELKKKWTAANIDSVNAHRRARLREAFLNDPEYECRYRLKMKMANSINKSLCGGKNGKRWEELVGYTLRDLMRHIENQFQPGMTWNNRGKGGWHIDYIIPISAFNIKSPEDIDFKRCWALKNLRPLWGVENIKKKDKIDQPFQPSLAMAI